LFQFEIWRRQATGTVAEIFGEEEFERDLGTRLFKFRGDLKEELNHYHDNGYEIITSYTDGVNAYIREIKENNLELPLEFKILGIEPMEWTPDVVISRHQGLLGNIEDELNIGRAVSIIGEDKVKDLMWFHPKEPSIKLDPRITREDLENDILKLYNAYREPIDFKSNYILKEYRSENDQLTNIESNIVTDKYSIGSNNWAISGEKSFNGYPLLANDPHRTIVAPSLRYMAHLVAPGWNVIGGGEPEIPGISIGHNGYGAWGLTVFRTDAEDLYVYNLNPNNPSEYFHNGKWEKFEVIKETISIKDKDDKEVELYYSVHGPVTFIDKKRNKAYAVKCGWLEIGGSPYLASLRMDQSKSWEEFRDACNYSNIPGENMVWADKDGNIGWQSVGIAPIRNTHSGLVPVMGDGNYEWDGYLPIIDKPSKFNPEEKYIQTANQNVTPDDYDKWNAIGFDWSDPFRGDRIDDILTNSSDFSMEDMISLQVDYHSKSSEKLIKMLSQSFDEQNKYYKLLSTWDNKLSKDSVAAGLYNAWELTVLMEFNKQYVPIKVQKYIQMQLYKIIEKLEGFSEKDRNRFIKSSFNQAVELMITWFGEETENWVYGQENYKHVKIKHPLEEIVTDSVYNLISLKAYPRGGNGYTPGSTGYNLNQSSGGSFRVLINTGDWDNSFATNSPGQSGDPDSKFYDNLYEDWANDIYFPLLYSKSKILRNLENRKVYYPQD
ncbi:MAG: penicillin acylase family protein, partial [Bacteroidota bacterium]|nr:penicillin acylase family protein [Bacteroidota bacterium]